MNASFTNKADGSSTEISIKGDWKKRDAQMVHVGTGTILATLSGEHASMWKLFKPADKDYFVHVRIYRAMNKNIPLMCQLSSGCARRRSGSHSRLGYCVRRMSVGEETTYCGYLTAMEYPKQHISRKFDISVMILSWYGRNGIVLRDL
jgi:hypothetical protein